MKYIKAFQVNILLLLLVFVSSEVKIVNVDNNIFLQLKDINVHSHEHDDVNAKLFFLEANAFNLTMPDMIGQIKNGTFKDEIFKYAAELINDANNEIIMDYRSYCTTDFGFPERTKRVEPVTIGVIVLSIGVVGAVVGGTVYLVKHEIELDNMRKEVEAIKMNLKDVISVLNNVSKEAVEERYKSEMKFTLTSYVQQQKKTILQFIKVLQRKNGLQLESLPAPLRPYFVQEGAENGLYFLKINKCSNLGMNIEVIVVRGKATKSYVCNNYEHAGRFTSTRFEKYLMRLICYDRGSCFEVNQDLCFNNFQGLNCSALALSKCYCDPTNVAGCQVKSVVAPQNFLQIEEIENLVLVATKTTSYSITKEKHKSTLNVPGNGIFILNLHEKDTLDINNVRVHGTSPELTHVAHVVQDTYTLPPPPEYSTVSYRESPVSDFSYYSVIIIGVLVFLILLTCFVFVLYLYCKK